MLYDDKAFYVFVSDNEYLTKRAELRKEHEKQIEEENKAKKLREAKDKLLEKLG